MEEKYKKAMVSNAQLDNDKGNLIYQVDTLKDVIEEMEEQTAEMKRELEDKTKVQSTIVQVLKLILVLNHMSEHSCHARKNAKDVCQCCAHGFRN